MISTSPPAIIGASIYVPISILSEITACLVPCNCETPSIIIFEVPLPSIIAPILIKHSIMSPTSGSQAALVITVVPLAIEAAIIRFSVAPTDANGKFIAHPFRPLAAVANK